MRDILFRGKKYNGEWEYGYPFFGGLNNELAYMAKIHTCSSRVIPETVGQYTGLTDKNGTKIFEGDIIKHHKTLWGEDVSDIGLILWCERTCKFYRTSKRDTVERFEIWEETAEHYEVIGNIHDNPELLGGDNK